MNPMVYCGIYPIDTNQYQDFKEALEKMELSDSSLVYEPESSQALAFLDLDVVPWFTSYGTPSTIYKVYLTDKTIIDIDNPAKMPDPQRIAKIWSNFMSM
ncbi:hypothetical protein FQA39_LY12925 [Lamprigera yunnana]|nr:hypothetical protein FQA39_LY12925 [Lamprigera yunnana]